MHYRLANSLHLFATEIVRECDRSTKSDRDFDGNGPLVNVNTRLSATDSTVTASVNTRFAETRDNWTTFSGTTTSSASIASRYPGWKIQSIASPTTDSFRYEDNDYAVNTFVRPLSSPVRQYQIQGDQDGGLFGGPDNPWTSVSFKPVQVRLQRV